MVMRMILLGLSLISIGFNGLNSCMNMHDLITPDRSNEKRLHWCYVLLLSTMLCSVVQSLISELSCRPVEMIYDLRYLWLLFAQLSTFLLSVFVGVVLGMVFVSSEFVHLSGPIFPDPDYP